MAISEVGAGSQRAEKSVASSGSTTLAFPGNVTAGNLLVVIGSSWINQTNTVTVTKSAGTATIGTITTYKSDWGSYLDIFITIIPVTGTGSCTIQVAWTRANTNFSFSIDEFTGQHATTPLRTDGGRSTGSGTTPSASLTSTSGDLILGVITLESVASPTLTPGGTYTQIGEEQDNNTYQCHNAEFKISTGNDAVNWTITSDTWDIYRIAIQPAAAGGGIGIPVAMQDQRMRRAA